MNISGLNNYSSTLNISSLFETETDTDDTTSSSTTSTSSSSNRADSLDLSKPSEIYSKLQELAETDPDKLKEVCGKIAEKLKSAAESGDGQDNKMLSDLAQKFQNVADGGDVSQLKPPEPPSFSGGQAPIDTYSKQQDTQTGLVNSYSGNHGHGEKQDQILSSILDEINTALED